jgi:hypothetical protein
MEMSAIQRLMVKESPPGIFLFIYEWVAAALLPALFLTEAFCSIAPIPALIIYKI